MSQEQFQEETLANKRRTMSRGGAPFRSDGYLSDRKFAKKEEDDDERKKKK